ncbi:alpha/beta hydrolase domain-containing protein [Cristinia sonorae]|uniref:Alpha/beta hydrolase domain-containing protein n=1 Tax=Cristinia sonorae TaxID=1940300 RepID=A0A8K0UWL4_9AGAR|nr:alpha/beta hydrolase domain-containing protein [Cristinia sonorae]
MEVISKITDRDIPSVLPGTVGAFLPLIQARESDIVGVKQATFKYGSTDRHHLDVYHPAGVQGGKAPVLFFFYGGGFTTGARVMPPPVDLIYRNLGAFFARKGFYTVLADYRLLPDVKFPGGSEDVRDSVVWIVENAAEVAKDSDVKLDTENIFIVGHSAGASHVITTFLLPGLFPSVHLPRIKGLFLNGGPYTYRADLLPPEAPIPAEILEAYFGPLQDLSSKEPLGLLESAPQSLLDSFPPLVVSRAEKEPVAIEKMNLVFAKAAQGKLKSVEEYVMLGHNHVSPGFSLGSGEGEEWGNYAAQWAKSKTVA